MKHTRNPIRLVCLYLPLSTGDWSWNRGRSHSHPLAYRPNDKEYEFFPKTANPWDNPKGLEPGRGTSSVSVSCLKWESITFIDLGTSFSHCLDNDALMRMNLSVQMPIFMQRNLIHSINFMLPAKFPNPENNCGAQILTVVPCRAEIFPIYPETGKKPGAQEEILGDGEEGRLGDEVKGLLESTFQTLFGNHLWEFFDDHRQESFHPLIVCTFWRENRRLEANVAPEREKYEFQRAAH